jgi:hypothetical protein
VLLFNFLGASSTLPETLPEPFQQDAIHPHREQQPNKSKAMAMIDKG